MQEKERGGERRRDGKREGKGDREKKVTLIKRPNSAARQRNHLLNSSFQQQMKNLRHLRPGLMKEMVSVCLSSYEV